MLKYWNYTVVLTFVSLSCALLGMSFSFDFIAGLGKPVWWSVICLLICGLCDAFDGRIARSKKDRTLSEIRFGIQLDSLCDIVCFGALPCCIGYAVGMKDWYFIPIFCFYCICGVTRLSYFNMKEEEELIAEVKSEQKTYTGMPITTVSLIFPVFYLLAPLCSPELFLAIFASAFIICGALFIIPFHIRKPGLPGILCMIGAGAIEAAVVVILLLLFKK